MNIAIRSSLKHLVTSKSMPRVQAKPKRLLVVAHRGGHHHGHSHDHHHDHDHDHKHGHEGCNVSSHSHPHAHSHSHDRGFHTRASSSGLAPAVTATSANCGHDHSHGIHSCHSHEHHHDPQADNAVSRGLQRVFDATGLTRLAHYLSESTTVMAAAVVAITVAIAAPFAAPLFPTSLLAPTLLAALSKACVFLVYALCGPASLLDLAYGVAALKIDVHVLMSLAALGAVALGAATEGGLLLVLFQLSHWLEDQIESRAKGDLSALFASVPTEACLVEFDAAKGQPLLGTQKDVSVGLVRVGDHCIVKAGERIPVDARIVHGSALISSEHVTGESLPVLRGPGDEVPAGSRNTDGVLVVQCLRVSDDSTPSRIAKLTADAQQRRPRLSKWIDDFGGVYSKFVLGFSLAMCFGTPVVQALLGYGQFPALLSEWVYRSLGFMTAASPCALVVVPLVYVSSISMLSQRGFLLKGGAVLDALAEASVVALDKTGTITTGQLVCAEFSRLVRTRPDALLGVEAASRMSPGDERAWAIAQALSERNDHPVSRAILQRSQAPTSSLGSFNDELNDTAAFPSQDAHAPHWKDVHIRNFRVIPGKGVEAEVSVGGEGVEPFRPVRLGNRAFACALLSGGVDDPLSDLARSGPTDGEASTPSGRPGVVSVLSELPPFPDSSSGIAQTAHVFRFEDSVRPSSRATVKRLTASGLSCVMLTGDNLPSALDVARRVENIREVHAGLSPEGKLLLVEKLRRGTNGKVIMVGDGLNDQPALATAHVGIAVAQTPNDGAAAAADVLALGRDEGISQIPLLLAVAKRNRSLVIQNLVLAGMSIVASSVPAALGVFPLWLAVLLHEGSTVLVALNSLRALRLPHGFREVEGGQGSVRSVVVPESRSPSPGEVDVAKGNGVVNNGPSPMPAAQTEPTRTT